MSQACSGANQNGWASRYATLAGLMYQVRRECPQLPVLGISTLHPRHWVPADHLRLLEAVEEEGSKGTGGVLQTCTPLREVPSLFALALRWLWCVLFACRESVRLLWVKLRVWPELRRIMREPATVVVKTWCFGQSSLSRSDDFYFGPLPLQLEARGVSCLLLCDNAREVGNAAFAQAVLRRKHIRAVPERLLVPTWAPLVTVLRQLAAALALRRLAQRASGRGWRWLCARACLDSLQAITLKNVLQFYSARAAVRTWGAKVFVTLYEGQPWEKLAWQGAKAADPACILVGYQHTVAMPHSLAVLSPVRVASEPSAPDVVLCLGDVTRGMMEKGHELHGTRFVSFGTYRRTTGEVGDHGPRPECRTVLVVPETGVIREAKLLFDFAILAARLSPDHRFIFRCHPVMPFARIRPHLRGCPEACANIEMSTREAILDDFTRSSVVLYRGSSSVLYAVLHGLKPIYLEDESYPEVDPLFGVSNGWRERIASPEALREALLAYLAGSPERAFEQWRGVVDYVDAYAKPVTERSIDQFLAAVGLANGAEPR